MILRSLRKARALGPPALPVRCFAKSSKKGGSKKGKKRRGGSGSTGGGVAGDFVLSLKGVAVSHGPDRVFYGVNLSLLRGAKIGVLGVNGSGKSTFLKVIAGETTHDGEVWTKEGVKVAYLHQEPQLDHSKTVMGNVQDGLKAQRALLRRYDEVAEAMGEPDADIEALLEEQSTLQVSIDELDCWSLDYRVERAMEALRVPPADSAVDVLSGGERRRVALARLLLEQPDVLLLDEPTNHLDASSVAWLEEFLAEYKGTVVAVTHDRYFLENIAGWILELDRGHAIPYEGNYSAWLVAKQERLDMERRKEANLAKKLSKELQWIRSGGQQRGNTTRLKQYDQLVEDSSAATNQAERAESGAIVLPSGPRLGQTVLEAQGLSMAVDGRSLFTDLSFSLPPGAVVGVIGGNGTGKTTLFSVLNGTLEPDAGVVAVGDTVHLGLVSQSRAELDPTKTVYEEVSQGQDFIQFGDEIVHVRSYAAGFNLKGSLQQALVGNLSGGERNRVHLAKMLRRAYNVLLLDEPTNDLDVETLRSLEEAIMHFPGSAMVISHDRFFLDRISTHTMDFRGDGEVVVFPGGFSDYRRSIGLD